MELCSRPENACEFYLINICCQNSVKEYLVTMETNVYTSVNETSKLYHHVFQSSAVKFCSLKSNNLCKMSV